MNLLPPVLTEKVVESEEDLDKRKDIVDDISSVPMEVSKETLLHRATLQRTENGLRGT
jgi:hypothetical protein